MSYLVLARKYRPQSFKDVVGQEHITQTLQNSLSNKRPGHAYLFSGPRGVGKTTMARIFAKALNCKNGPGPEPCNKCTACDEISSGFSLDVIEIDGASNRRIEEIRTLKENVKFAPTSHRYKIYIIDEVHMLTTEAFNALLKTLEEPPAHIVFIFATTEPHKVPLTILSRCQRFNFRQISLDEIVSTLEQIVKLENVKITTDALYLIAKSASGSLRDALTVLDEVISLNPKKVPYKDVVRILGIIDYGILVDFGEIIAAKEIKKAFLKVEELVNSGYDLGQFVKDLREHFRNLLIVKVTDKESSLVTLASNNLKDVELQSEKFSQADLLRAIDILSNLEGRMKYSDQKRLVLELGMAKLCSSFVSLDAILKKVETLEDKLNIKDRKKPDTVISNLGNQQDLKIKPVSKEPVQEKNTTFSEELGGLKGIWGTILKSIDSKKGSLTAFLRVSQPVGVTKGVITLAFNKSDKFSKESVDRKENKDLLSKVIEEVIHKKFTIKCILRDNNIGIGDNKEISRDIEKRSPQKLPKEETPVLPKSKSPVYTPKEIVNREPIIEKALDIFNGEIAEIE